MTTLIFVSISVMSCYGNVLTTSHGALRKCEYGHELIVRAEALSMMKEKKYFLGPISKEVQTGCQVTLTNGETVMSGKPCRRLMGEK
jgi:hypothetical protein